MCLLLGGFCFLLSIVAWFPFPGSVCSVVISNYWGVASREKVSVFVQVQHTRGWSAAGLGNTLANLCSGVQLLLCMLAAAVRTCVFLGHAVDLGNPTLLWAEGGDDFLRKLLAEKTTSLWCLLLGGQQQDKGGAWLSAEVARIGRDYCLGVHSQVLCPPSPST